MSVTTDVDLPRLGLTLLDNTDNLLILHGSDGVPIWVNESGAARLGYMQDEFEYAWPSALSADATAREDIRGCIDKALRGERSRCSFSCTHRDGSTKWFESVMIAAPNAGFEAGKVLSISNDITLSKAIQDSIRESRNRAEELSAFKSAVLNSVSHELKTPLTTIIGYADLLSSDLFGEKEEFVGEIHQSGMTLRRVLDEILDFSLVESHSLKPHIDEVDVAEVLNSSILDVRQHREPHAHVQTRCHIPDVAMGLADRHSLGRIFSYVLDNAFKFTTSGSILIDLTPADSHVVVVIEDTGCGVSSDFLPFVYDAFKQESVGLDRAYSGLGLGLTIAKSFAGEMNVDISLESSNARGTRVSIHVPR